MIRRPCLKVDLAKIRENARIVRDTCAEKGIEIVGITKGCSALPQVAKAMVEGGVTILGDSRIQNIQKMRRAGITTPMMLIRPPMLSEIESVVAHADYSLNSEMLTIKALAQKAVSCNLIHNVILMIELGELREGVMPRDVVEMSVQIESLQGVRLAGFGATFNCISGIMPSIANLSRLTELTKTVETKLKRPLDIISGGNTSVWKLISENQIPERINQLRLGIAILIGQDDSRCEIIPGTYQDTFVLTAEVIEVKQKPSVPKGKTGINAFGAIEPFKDIGLRQRAILAVGRQDICINALTPFENGVHIIGASSDHLVVDVTELSRSLEIGDELSFGLDYTAILAATTSNYISLDVRH